MGLLEKYFMRRRGGQLKCRLTGGYTNPPLQLNRRLYTALTRCVCTGNPFIHFVYGDHDLVARGRYCIL